MHLGKIMQSVLRFYTLQITPVEEADALGCLQSVATLDFTAPPIEGLLSDSQILDALHSVLQKNGRNAPRLECSKLQATMFQGLPAALQDAKMVCVRDDFSSLFVMRMPLLAVFFFNIS